MSDSELDNRGAKAPGSSLDQGNFTLSHTRHFEHRTPRRKPVAAETCGLFEGKTIRRYQDIVFMSRNQLGVISALRSHHHLITHFKFCDSSSNSLDNAAALQNRNI